MRVHFESLPEGTKQALRGLAGMEALAGFYLAGGTGLALRLGHRVSADLDFFRQDAFREQSLVDALAQRGGFSLTHREPGTVHGNLDGIKASFFHYPYPLLEEPAAVEGIRVASVRDSACMKLDAIGQRGSKRDFVDLYVIARKAQSLDRIVDDYREKYAKLNVNVLHLLKGLTYFADADAEPMPKMLEDLNWDDVKSFFTGETKRLSVL